MDKHNDLATQTELDEEERKDRAAREILAATKTTPIWNPPTRKVRGGMVSLVPEEQTELLRRQRR